MPITINGGGTITGLSVGGLPDGVIDNGCMADDAIDSAEVADGSIDAVHLASGVGGKILQIKYGSADTAHRQSNSTSFVTASNTCTVAITPSAQNTKILAVCNTQVSCNDGNDGWAATIVRTVGGSATNLGVADAGLAYGNSVPGICAVHYPVSMHVVDGTHTAGGATPAECTYQLQVKVHDIDSDGNFVNVGQTGYGTSSGDVVDSFMYVVEFL